jgi:hypothetical protein
MDPKELAGCATCPFEPPLRACQQAVKDRLLGHNPLAAIYTIDGYDRSLKAPIRQE